jgi:serine O-acetyltransferase
MPNVPSHNWGLEQIVADLRASREELHRTRHPLGIRELPSREAVVNIVAGLRAALFPTHYGAPDLTDETVDYYVGHTLESTLRLLAEQIRRALRFLPEHAQTPETELRERAFEVARQFGTQLPGIRALLVSDIQAAFTGDPAAQHITEIRALHQRDRALGNRHRHSPRRDDRPELFHRPRHGRRDRRNGDHR